MAAVMELKPTDIDAMCAALDDKLITTLSKYLFAAFDLISQKD